MEFLIPFFALLLAVLAGGLVVPQFLGQARTAVVPGRGKDAVVRAATKRLAKDPGDYPALRALGDVALEEQNWAEVFRIYEAILKLDNIPLEDIFENYLRYSLAAVQLDRPNDAYEGFSTARNIDPQSFIVNSNLGFLEFGRGNADRAIVLLEQARTANPEDLPTLRTLGQACFKLTRYKEALDCFRTVTDRDPADQDSLFTLGECCLELGQTDEALRVLSGLRDHETLGPRACLICGTIHRDALRNDEAIADYTRGLQWEDLPGDIEAELRYRLALIHLSRQELDKALSQLKAIDARQPDYKDVDILIEKYQELYANRNLQTFLMASQDEFITLCRALATAYFPKSRVKVTSILNAPAWTDLVTEVHAPKWSEVILFRFIRSQGMVGELVVRELHTHLKDFNASKGICMSIGAYSESARHFVDARPVDLVDKDRLTQMLTELA